ncbi:MAG: DUF5615 family PIN-like protein, partial [Pseudonocardiaceae bacterium]
MTLLLDEMYPPALAEKLRAQGHDVLAVAEDFDLVGSDDEAVLAYAIAAQRCLVTENVRDFAALAKHTTHYGLLLTHPRRWPRHGSSKSGGSPYFSYQAVRSAHELVRDGAWGRLCVGLRGALASVVEINMIGNLDVALPRQPWSYRTLPIEIHGSRTGFLNYPGTALFVPGSLVLLESGCVAASGGRGRGAGRFLGSSRGFRPGRAIACPA